MKLISHRGNIEGKDPNNENSPHYIEKALKMGYDVEIDVWWVDNSFWLGHDKPQYKITPNYILNNSFWCHAKNGEALHEMRKYDLIHCFWHQEDDFILTSKGFIWTYPNKLLYSNSVCVLPELGYKGDITRCYAICSDYIKKYKDV
mgnify:CR=1 FL=1